MSTPDDARAFRLAWQLKVENGALLLRCQELEESRNWYANLAQQAIDLLARAETRIVPAVRGRGRAAGMSALDDTRTVSRDTWAKLAALLSDHSGIPVDEFLGLYDVMSPEEHEQLMALGAMAVANAALEPRREKA